MKKKSAKLSYAVRMLKVLVFLPPEQVVEGFKVIVDYLQQNLVEITEHDEWAPMKVIRFMKYVER
ncbi:MAG: hypothetical protein FJ333_09085 [Sphingomonadales bacterium]|nr:hypothetical protein [Sphingomonadales bacterium]